ncbi:uncharacterized protein B0H18DRAFT_498543 [Fomitopsis serialis]|uniref:uncharacterized protein n=1 Tax=Fomitopsis serialis TaxID=139415 RepID=UPI002007EAE1|nr:uncharacterized protein B0H18DRAFT_498543 [Neoantrodia serialis]KAH9922951.1 hypothetical protein B0H18DRAFT_498543 [Neoantrodia serialis]
MKGTRRRAAQRTTRNARRSRARSLRANAQRENTADERTAVPERRSRRHGRMGRRRAQSPWLQHEVRRTRRPRAHRANAQHADTADERAQSEPPDRHPYAPPTPSLGYDCMQSTCPDRGNTVHPLPAAAVMRHFPGCINMACERLWWSNAGVVGSEYAPNERSMVSKGGAGRAREARAPRYPTARRERLSEDRRGRARRANTYGLLGEAMGMGVLHVMPAYHPFCVAIS